MSFEVVKRILEAYRGAEFIKTDLHIHTPASVDWNQKNPESVGIAVGAFPFVTVYCVAS